MTILHQLCQLRSAVQLRLSKYKGLTAYYIEDSYRFMSEKLEYQLSVISIQNHALCYYECCTDFINCCVSSIQSYSTSKCVDQPGKSAFF